MNSKAIDEYINGDNSPNLREESMGKVFIIGPIEKPLPDFNSLEFHLAEVFLQNKGYEVVNIHNIVPEEGKKIQDVYIDYLYELISCDKAFTIAGYQHSPMCRSQLVIAQEFGIQIIDLIKSDIIEGNSEEDILNTLFREEMVGISVEWFMRFKKI